VKKTVLFEDFTNHYNKWVSGIASRELGSQRVTLKDLFDKSVSDQLPGAAKAEKVLPFPLPSVVEQVGELYLNATNTRALFNDSLRNPIINKNESAFETVKQVVAKLDNIINEINHIFKITDTPVAKK
jgi:hypothetical protein